MKYFVYWVTGSCQHGDRNAGLGEFDTIEEARKEIEDITEMHPRALWILIHGEEVDRDKI